MTARAWPRPRTVALVIALSTFVLAPTIGPLAPLHRAVAQPAGGDRVARARAFTEQGLAFYDAGDGGRALAAFRAAYELVPINELLLDLGLAAERAGDATVAVDYFERFLAVEARDPRRAEIRTKIAALREQVEAAEGRRRDEETAHQAELDRAAEAARARDRRWTAQHDREQVEEVRRAEQARAHHAIEGRGRGLRLGGLALIGGGVLAFGAATYFGLDARALSSELSAHGAQFDPATVAAGHAADRHLIASLIAGGVLVATGVTLHVVGRRQRVRARLIVTSTRETVALTCAGSF